MSRRQALGVISNQYNQLATNNNVGLVKPHPLKAHVSAPVFNDENEYPMSLATKKSEFDFEIFQEECASQKKLTHELQNALVEKVEVVFSNDYDEDDEDYAEEEEEEEEEEQGDEDDEHEVDEEEEEEEEEGICRLKFAALSSESDEKSGEEGQRGAHAKSLNTSELHLMDSSQSESMILDDTIKLQASWSASCEQIDEDDEEARQMQMLQEREDRLVNFDEYKDEILSYMRQEEKENRSKAHYMKKQQDITGSMRSILVDWLVEVSEEYKLNVETLYLAVNYTDRFLSQMSVLRGKLQLVGTASMYIAAKYEEISPPDVTEFVYITDDTYTKKQVLRMEHLLLKVLDFRMNTPTINCFLTHYLRFMRMAAFNTSDKVESLARYLAEITLIESETFLKYLPSEIAASAVYLSLFSLGRKWTKPIADQLGYDFDLHEIKGCIIDMYRTMQQAPAWPQQAIQEKYKSSKYQSVSQVEAPVCLPSFIYQ